MSTCEHTEPREREVLKTPDEVLVQVAEFFKAAGNPARLRVLYYLLEGEACVSELSEQLGTSMSSLSQHLKTLRMQKIVGARREGKHMYYFLVDHHVMEIVRMALEHAMEE